MTVEIDRSIVDKVPHAVTQPDQIPTKRYFDPEFYELENEKLWSRVWQMACRLEEIPENGDYVVYRILDLSVIVIRVGDTIKAYHNHCRHRGVELVQKRGRTLGGFVCPFHGWRWDANGQNTFVYEPEAFSPANMCEADLNLKTVRLEIWGGCAFINFDDDAPALRESIEPFASHMDLFKVEQLRTEWWLAARLPVNWKLAMEAFMEGYHVATTHPQLLPPGVTSRPGEARYLKMPDGAVAGGLWATVPAEMPAEVDSKQFIEMYIRGMSVLNEGMAGMTAAEEIEVIKGLVDVELPKDSREAFSAWRKASNDAIMAYYREKGMDVGDINELDRTNQTTSVNFCFPHFFLLPVHGAASSYRIRPLGPEETLFELWSLKRYPAGEEPGPPLAPEPMEHNDPRWPPIPKQDFSNLPRQQRGLHSAGFEFMRLSQDMEGLISNYQRLIDGYLSDHGYDKLVPAVQQVSGPIDVPIKDIGF